MDELVSDFIAETREGLEALDSELVRFEQKPDDPETLGGIFRLIHTIKGTCGFLGLTRLQTVAHSAENVLGAFRDGILPVSNVAVSAVLETVDLIRVITDALSTTGSEPEGDDSVLIGRLEAVLAGEPASTPERPVPEDPSGDGRSTDTRKLIERLGGDATLDSAAETVLGMLQTDKRFGGVFAESDIDRLQAAIRDSLSGLARGSVAAVSLLDSLSAVAVESPSPAAVHLVFETVAAALFDLDVPAEAIDALRDLVAAPVPVKSAMQPDLSSAVSEKPSELPRLEPHPDASVPSPILAQAPGVSQSSEVQSSDVETSGPTQTIRVSVDALEHLMTVVSELVLIRNQLIQTLRLDPESAFAAPLNRLNQVTSELQEGVMTTRMQPIGGAWAKLPRLVRDLAQDLSKQIELVMLGQETELDRQVLELIKDPLTHMIRNAADHGLETSAERVAAGKPKCGRITLQARHEGGAIVIEVADDGRGLPAEKIRAKALSSGIITQAQAEVMSDAEARQLIFLPGLSTATEVTSVSGRGVGMDVVRTNIEKIGGVIELTSVEGGGTRFTIRIPLTLTIVSALIVECCGDRFAMPQSSIVELVSASGGAGRKIEYINGAAVLRLRDRLLPLVSLQSLMKLDPVGENASETCIVVVKIGAFTFGVMVDRVFDTEEIVVKPVATVLRHVKLYSGATIMGDGSVILILDLKSISSETGAGQTATGVYDEVDAETKAKGDDRSAILVFRAVDDSLKAAPLASVSRIEEVEASQIERVDQRMVIQYRGKLMPILGAEERSVSSWQPGERRPLLVFARDDQAVGLLVNEIVDVVESTVVTDLGASGAGVIGSLIIGGAATELIDVTHYWREAMKQKDQHSGRHQAFDGPQAQGARRLLVIDESPFTQLLLKPLLAQAGYEVIVANGPEDAMSLYERGESFHLIMADTSNRDAASRFAQTMGQASKWHATPLLSIAQHKGGMATGSAPPSTLLDAVSEALGDLRSAA